jgi:hypothetical protein
LYSVISAEIAAVQNDLNTKHEDLAAEDVRLAGLIENEASAREIADNTLSSTVGSYEFVDAKPAEGETPGVEAHYDATGYFDVAKTHLEGEVNKLNAEDARLAGLITAINETTIPALAGTNNTSTVAANAQAIANLAGTNVENNTVAGNAKAISELTTGAVKTNTNSIKDLKDNFDKAISLTKAEGSEVYTLTDGVVKDYIDAVEGKIGELDTAYKNADKALTIKTIECGSYKLDDSNKPTDNNGTEKHSLKITFSDNNTAYYPLGDYIKDNYYTKT